MFFITTCLVFEEEKESVHVAVKLRPFYTQTCTFKFDFVLYYKIGAVS